MDFSSATPFHIKQTNKPEEQLVNLRTKMLQKSQLKSNIPKPVPYVRVKRERSKSCSPPCFKSSISSLCTISTPNSRSTSSRGKPLEKSCKSFIQAHSLPSTNPCRSQYSDIKPKIDNSTPLSLLLKIQGPNPKDSPKQLNHLMGGTIKDNTMIEKPPGDHQINSARSTQLEKGRPSSTTGTYSECERHQSSLNPHIPEGDGCTLQKKYNNQLERPKHLLLKECAPEFLSSFGRQIEEVSEMWLRLICDLIMNLTMLKSVTPQLSLHDSKLSVRDVVFKIFQNLPTQELGSKLCKIEEAQVNILRVVIQNVVTLVRELLELKRKHFHLKETNEQNQSQLKEELAILGEENKELDRKYISAVERCELEKSKTEEMGENQIQILKKILELRNIVKHIEKKCSDLEMRNEKVETSRQKLEECVKSLENNHENESKKYENLSKTCAESENIIIKVRGELKESENSKLLLEQKITEHHIHMIDLKAELENSLQKRNDLEKEVIEKDKKIRELDVLINSFLPKTTVCDNENLLEHENNIEPIKVLVNGAEQRNPQIQEFKKKVNRLENMVKDKSNREEKLLSQVTKLTKKCNNKCTSFNNQIKQLQIREKSLQNQVSELEKLLGQKMLELDQKDRLIKELKELVRLKNESDSSICLSRKRISNVKLTDGEESTSCHKKMFEILNLLECKHMEIMKLERRIWGLQNIHNEQWKSGITYQAKMAGNVFLSLSPSEMSNK